MPLSTSTGVLVNGGSSGGGTGTSPVNSGTFAQPRKRPSDVALDTFVKKIKTKDGADGSRPMEVTINKSVHSTRMI